MERPLPRMSGRPLSESSPEAVPEPSAPEPGPRVRVFGIRHHGPGCARSLESALEAWTPDVVLIEGPPDAAPVVALAGQESMVPPVALLVYAPDAPNRAAFFPFTDFSPEWCAIRWALANDVEPRFIDLPQSIRFRQEDDALAAAALEEDDVPRAAPIEITRPVDPIGELAAAAGYDDGESWWDQVVERREDSTGLFEAILEAMTAVREARPGGETLPPGDAERLRELRREAWMRKCIGESVKEGHERIAVVCGAWHAPMLTLEVMEARGRKKADRAALKGLRKRKVAATWVPWTNSRLAFRSGYGAGVESPGWYRLLWEYPTDATMRWLSQVALLLRAEGFDVSSAHVIEGVRLAEALAAIRDLPRPGLAEMNDAVQTVLLEGRPEPMALIRSALEVGETLGEVPPETPTVPLQQDVSRKQKSLRLKVSADARDIDLDLRKPNDRAKSRLLHQLRLLGVYWGEPIAGRVGRGTFHEYWRLRWRPEFAVALIDAASRGNTTEGAVVTTLAEAAAKADVLRTLTTLLDRAVLAGVPDGVDLVLLRLRDVAAVSGAVIRLMEALPDLARVLRYGDVRETPTEQIAPILDSFLDRILPGVVPASGGIDDAGSESLCAGMAAVARTLGLLERDDLRDPWHDVLRHLAGREATHARVRGSAVRGLLEDDALNDEALARYTSRELSRASEPADAAAWLTGVLGGSGLVLLHRDAFWSTFDSWLTRLPEEHFRELLAPLRRAFSSFSKPERRRMGQRIRALRSGSAVATQAVVGLDETRAATLVPVLASLMGVSHDRV